MRILFGIAGVFLVGGYFGYVLGTELAGGLFDSGNVYKLFGVLFTAPLGALSAGLTEALLKRPWSSRQISDKVTR
jgi:hypothetical protein